MTYSRATETDEADQNDLKPAVCVDLVEDRTFTIFIIMHHRASGLCRSRAVLHRVE